jgi:hypothetical protein
MTAKIRTKSIKIKVTENEFSELNDLKEKSGYSALAVYLRETGLNQKVSPKKDYAKIDPELLFQLSGMGNNINQIARQVNSSELKARDAMQIIATLASIDTQLSNVRAAWSVNNDS